MFYLAFVRLFLWLSVCWLATSLKKYLSDLNEYLPECYLLARKNGLNFVSLILVIFLVNFCVVLCMGCHKCHIWPGCPSAVLSFIIVLLLI